MDRKRSPFAEVTALDVLTLEVNDFAHKWRKQRKQWRAAVPSPSASPLPTITNPQISSGFAKASQRRKGVMPNVPELLSPSK